MQRMSAGAFLLLLSFGVGCRRPVPPALPPLSTSSPEPTVQQSSTSSRDLSVNDEAPRMRPERAAAAAAAASRKKTPPPKREPSHYTGIPETKKQAETLMTQIDHDIIDQELEPGVARHLRASFRGRLIAAGMPKETIEAWLEAKFTP